MSANAVPVEACRLLENPNVIPMLKDLRRQHAERHNVTVDSLTLELENVRQGAEATHQYGAAVSAILGIIIDKSKLDLTTHEDALRALQDLMEPPGNMNGATLQ
jgi:phage terminase small subunit